MGIAFDLIGAQIKDIGFGIFRRFRFDARFFIRTKSCAERLGNLGGQLSLQTERVGNGAVIPICPKMPIMERINQLDVHHHAIAFPADTSLQHIRYPESLSDVAQIPRSVGAISHYTSATDDPQTVDFGKARENIILNSVSKECILFSFAHIRERKDRDAFFQNGPGGAATSHLRGTITQKDQGAERQRDSEEQQSCYQHSLESASGSLFAGKLFELLGQLRVASLIGVKVNN